MMNVGKKVIVCDKCSAEFLMRSVQIQECSVEIGGEKLLLDYFVCPKCNEIYKVLLVEEKKYRELVNDLLSTTKRIRKWQGKGNVQMLERLRKMATRKKNRLQSYTNQMNAKYGGTFTFKASENNQKEIVYLP